MKFTLTLIDWQARAPGLSDADEWQAWSRRSDAIDPTAPLAKLTDLPMMTARRLNSGSRLAVDLGLMMLRKHRIDAVVYSSRHGELERNFRILQPWRQNSPFPPILPCRYTTRRSAISLSPRVSLLSLRRFPPVWIPSSRACATC